MVSACDNRIKPEVHRGMYYWKTSYRLSPYETQRFQQLQISRLYLRCFDVGFDKAAGISKPIAIVRLPDVMPPNLEIVPVVFITEDVLRNLNSTNTKVLATHINKLLEQLCNNAGIQPVEIQIDADWTSSNREAYFMLLQLLRQSPYFIHKTLSCTIRLHQIKYSVSSGYPPVDKGMLMVYNLGNLRQPGDHNSIFNAALAKDYLSKVSSYPIDLDFALPIFDWVLWFRNNTFKGIVREVSLEHIKSSPLFKLKKESRYTCITDTFWQGYDFRRGDEVRLEKPDLAGLKDVANYLNRQRKDSTFQVVLFHADSLLLTKYPNDELEEIFDAFD